MMKKFAILLLLFFGFLTSGYGEPETFVIDATKNAYFHNNLGINYLKEHCYYAAIQEFKIAISLNPNTQATSVYYKNIGDAYMAIGYPDMAKQPYEDAITQYSLNLQYYQKLAKCYKELKLIPSKIEEYSNDKNALNKVMLGILYIEQGDLKRGTIILDEFVNNEPDLLITPAIRQYISDTLNTQHQ